MNKTEISWLPRQTKLSAGNLELSMAVWGDASGNLQKHSSEWEDKNGSNLAMARTS